jgi:hypothetical protein
MPAWQSIPGTRGAFGERRDWTRSGNSEFFGWDWIGFANPPYPGLEIIQNQTLPRVIVD